MGWVYFKSEDEGDGTYDGQIGRVYLELDDGSTGDEGRDLGWMSLADASEIAQKHGVELDVDGPTREEWDKIGSPKRSLLNRLLGRWAAPRLAQSLTTLRHNTDLWSADGPSPSASSPMNRLCRFIH